MFTGIITEVGRVLSLSRGRGAATRITIASHRLSRRLRLGDSIAVSGVCLTAVAVRRGSSFSADLAAETLRRTSLARLARGARANLELPLRAGEPLGGHVVQGHVDVVARLLSLERAKKEAKDYSLRLQLPSALMRYVAPKGSITIEGISLTVARVAGNRLTVAIIPHTFQATNLSEKKSGDPLNIEVDVLAKYAARLCRKQPRTHVTRALLRRQGFYLPLR